MLCANYSGMPSAVVTPLEGIRAAVGPHTKVWTPDGCKHLGIATDGLDRAGISPRRSASPSAPTSLSCASGSPQTSKEKADAGNSEAAGDKRDLRLTGLQNALLEAIVSVGKPTVLVVISGSPLDSRGRTSTWAPSSSRSTRVSRAARQSPMCSSGKWARGRLPVTFPRDVTDLPPFEDYAMRGRTYRYAVKEPLYPFGFGLSYTRFRYWPSPCRARAFERAKAWTSA